MKKQTYILLLGLVISLASSINSFAAPNGHWRWTDDKGVVQYSDHPPMGVKAEFVKFASTKHSGSKSDQEASNAENSSDKSELPSEMEVLPEKDPALCAQAQGNLKALEAARIRITEPDGTKRILTEEEKEGQRENARKFIKIHC